MEKANNEVTLVVDGVSIKAQRGIDVAEACLRAGIFVPSLSADTRLPRNSPSKVPLSVPDPVGIAEFPNGVLRPASEVLVTSDNLVVKFKSPAARERQKAALEKVLSEHHGDCYPPCQMACPCKVPGADFLKLVLENRNAEALMMIMERNPFALVCGTVCPRFCEDACRRNVIDEAVNINDVKRFLYEYNRIHKELVIPVLPPTGKKVAIVGAGPAGLACAHFLARKGHKAIVHEALPKPGGMLRYGIPEYRLPKEELDGEIKAICTDIGVEIHCNSRMGKDFQMADLQRDYDAVYVALGAQLPTMLRFPGSDMKGVLGGVDYLRDVASGLRPKIGNKVVVIGGGNVSIDVARTCLRLGSKDVTLTCILRKEDMPAHPLEIKECLAEGCKIDNLAQPMRVTEGKEPGTLAIEYRRRPRTADIFDFAISIPGSEYTYDCDTVILAVGQRLDTDVCRASALPLSARGNSIAADSKTFLIGSPDGGKTDRCVGVFAGGDAVLTPMTVVHCVSTARKASIAIDALLNGNGLDSVPENDHDTMKYYHSRGSLEDLLETQKAVTQGPKRVPYYAGVPLVPRNQTVETMSHHEAATNFRSITAPFTDEMAVSEAKRCLQCGCGNARTCHLRRVCEEVGVESKTIVPTKPQRVESDNPFFNRDLDKCVHCTKCFRACSEIRNIGAIEDPFSMTWKAQDFSLRRGAYDPFACESCGTCLDVCPTNALYPKRKEYSGTEIVKTTCSFCGCGCGLLVQTRNGFPVTVKGDPASKASHGQLCVKGRFGLVDYNTTKERLTTPLIRNKEGELVPATWDEAMSLVASKFAEIKKKHGADALQGLASAKVCNEENYLLMKVFRSVLGTNNIDHCARLCHSSTVAGLATVLGSGAMTNSTDELEYATCILVTGSNTTETHPIIALKIKAAVKRGAKLIVCDPRKINLKEYATMYLSHRSGTDVCLFNAFMQVILSENLHAKSFVEEHLENFPAFEAEVMKYPPEFAEPITGVPAHQIRAAARMYATSKASSIIFSMGITQHSTGVDNVMTLANLAMVTGQIGRPSTGVNPLRGQNNVQGACDMGALPNVFSGYQKVVDPNARAKFEKAWGSSSPLPDKVGLTVTHAMNAALSGKLKAIYCMGENPMMSDPNLHHVEEALRSLEFFVVQDIFLTETAKLAHVVLPSTSLFEKMGTFTNTERRVLRVAPVKKPPTGVRHDWEILVDFANRLGAKYSYPRGNLDILDEINSLTPSYGGITNSRIDADLGLQWPCPNAEHPGTMFLHKDGKFARGKGLLSAIPFREPAELPDAEYPLVMSTGRVLYQYHTGTMSRKCPGLNEVAPTTHVEMHENDAKRAGVKDQERVHVVTRRGRITATALVPSRIREGSVFLPFHYNEAPANILTNDALDPVASIPEFKACACKIEKISDQQ